MRSDTTFISAGTGCAGWLYRPDRADAGDRVPIVVMAHGFSGTRELRLPAYAERFRAAGVGVLLFDYRHFGASGGLPRQLLDIGRQLADYRAAVAHVRGLDWVDADRVGLFGTSFSGGHVLAVAAGDPRIAAVIAQCPFTDGLATLRLLDRRSAAGATLAGLRDAGAALLGRPPVEIPATGEPGSVAAMTTPDAKPGFARLLPSDGEHRWENRVAARVMLRVASYRPGRQTSRIAAPILFCLCDQDALTPAKTAARWAARAPRAEVRHYPAGHFEIYVGELWERAVADQTEFLMRTLRPGDSTLRPLRRAGAAAA